MTMKHWMIAVWTGDWSALEQVTGVIRAQVPMIPGDLNFCGRWSRS
jgi:hypothetical protein